MSLKRKREAKQTMTSNKKIKEPLTFKSKCQNKFNDIRDYFSKGGDKNASSKGEKSPSGDKDASVSKKSIWKEPNSSLKMTRSGPSSGGAGASTSRLPPNSNIGAQEDDVSLTSTAKFPNHDREGSNQNGHRGNQVRPTKYGAESPRKFTKTKEQVHAAGPHETLRNGSTQNDDHRGRQELSKPWMASPTKTADISPRRKQDQRSNTGQQKPGPRANSRKVTDRADVGEQPMNRQGRNDHPISDSDDSQDSVHAHLPADPSPRRKQPSPISPSAWSARDTEAYRKGYPGKLENESLNYNWRFYNNQMECRPRGAFIDTIHKHWYRDYSLLEDHHGYIQWLFPIREKGMNVQSQELQLHEAKKIRESPEASKRVLTSFKMMLDFWGMRLASEDTESSLRIEREINWKERFRHLNRSSHNYLRITRMLKSLGELGLEHLKYPFLEFVLNEAIAKQTLSNARNSCLQYWIHTLVDGDERNKIMEYANELLEETGN